jgi:colanic acid/amylovoran biosynthesis glycosyltransferase
MKFIAVRFHDLQARPYDVTSVTFCAYDKPDNVGGPVSWLQRIAPLLQARGIEVRCLFIMHWGNRGPALDSLRAAGIDCAVAMGLDVTEQRVRWILDELRKNPPDVFVPNLVVAAYHAAKWVRKAGIPTVGILHSDDAFYQALLKEFLNGPASRRVSAMVAVSRRLEDLARESSAKDVIIKRIPYGVQIPSHRVQRVSGKLRLAYVGRLSEEQKRIGDVVRALTRATSELDGVDATIYGDGPDRPLVESQLVEAGNARVSFGGVVNSEDIQMRMLQADAIVLLSDYEGLPISLLEAMACGCVPVCSDMSSGIPELVRNGETGLIVENRSDAFVSAIARLRDDPALWTTLSRNARQLVKNQFSAERSANEWASLLIGLAKDARVGTIPNPRRLSLPPVNTALASADVRQPKPSLPKRAVQKTRMVLGRARRRIFHVEASAAERLTLGNATIVRISGGLANQMLCYKVGRFVAALKKSKLIIDASQYDPVSARRERSFQLDKYDLVYDAMIFSERTMSEIRGNNLVAYFPKEMLDDKSPRGHERILQYITDNDIVYCDLWLGLRLRADADSHAESSQVLDELTLNPSTRLDDADLGILQSVRSAPNAVAIHVRRGDFATHDGNLLLTSNYYNQSIRRLEDELTGVSFFVFSDDIAWCKDNLKARQDIHFVDFHDDESGYKDMYLASQCRHFILSNESTFSHQIVQLNNRPTGRMVITSSKADLVRNQRS